tara:strand:+ start:1251 stop:1652 length:402 start_codon:yes stop_codon:yes gene_type:complete
MSEQTILHQKSFAIAWGDMDALGHVNNGKYFDYFQEARIEWLQTLNLNLKQSSGPVVVHVSATFHKPVIYPAILNLASSLQTLGHSSITLHHTLKQDEKLMTEGISKIVWVDYNTNKSISLPSTITNLLHQSS